MPENIDLLEKLSVVACDDALDENDTNENLSESEFKDQDTKILELRRFRHLLDIVSDAIFVVELATGVIADINQTACKFLCTSRNELKNKDVYNFLPDKTIQIAFKKLQSINKIKKINQKIYTDLIMKSGKRLPVEVSIRTAAFDKKLYAIFVARDISDRVQSESELIRVKEIAERSDKLKTEFIAQISHEIRTPLNSILSLITLLKDELKDKLPSDLNSSIRIIDDGSKRLIRTVEQMLNISQVHTGTIDLDIKEINLTEDILEYLILDYYSVCKKKGISLEFYNNCKKPLVDADFETINQVFTNLIDNAVKYTNFGYVEIKIYNDNNNNVCVDIKDTGIGISEYYLPFIFQPFTQEENLNLRTTEGTGLGLAIVKKYTELNNAEIFVRSEKGMGTVFTVVFNK